MSVSPNLEPCHLCHTPSVLQESHIIPSWIYKDEIRDLSRGGQLFQAWDGRITGNAITLPLLCRGCEQKFGRWENKAKRMSQRSRVGERYDKWFYWFATSISWRNLAWHRLTGGIGESGERSRVLSLPAASEAEEVWRQSLHNEQSAPGSSRFRQHFFAIAPDYDLRRSALLALCDSGEHAFTFTRFGLYAILGMIENRRLGSLGASEVKIGGGRVNGVQVMPVSLIRHLHDFDVNVRRVVRHQVASAELARRR